MDAAVGMMTTVIVPVSLAFTCPGNRDRVNNNKNRHVKTSHVFKDESLADIYQHHWLKANYSFLSTLKLMCTNRRKRKTAMIKTIIPSPTQE